MSSSGKGSNSGRGPVRKGRAKGRLCRGTFYVKKILDMRVGNDGQVEYQVAWMGYGSDGNTWEPEGHINQWMIDDFNLRRDNRSRSKCSAREEPPEPEPKTMEVVVDQGAIDSATSALSTTTPRSPNAEDDETEEVSANEDEPDAIADEIPTPTTTAARFDTGPFKEDRERVSSSGRAHGPERKEKPKTKTRSQPRLCPGTFYVDHIRDRRVAKDGQVEYQVQWVGYGPRGNTWEPECHINQWMIDDFNERQANRNTGRLSARQEPPEAMVEGEGEELTTDEDEVDETTTPTAIATGFDMGYQAQEIVGAMPESGTSTKKVLFKIRYEGGYEDFVPAKVANKKCPLLVISFYEARLC